MQQRHLLAAYGRDLGAAFQIADDVLDVEGDATEIGKTAGRMRPPARRPWWRSSAGAGQGPCRHAGPAGRGAPRRVRARAAIYAPWLLSWLSGEAD